MTLELTTGHLLQPTWNTCKPNAPNLEGGLFQVSKALFIRGPRDAQVAPFNLREGQPTQVLLDVAAVGLCGSDLHYYKDGGIGSAVIQSPFVPGHEFAGYLCQDLENAIFRAEASSQSTPTGPVGIAPGVAKGIRTCALMSSSSERPPSMAR
jgi:hypothetical protein